MTEAELQYQIRLKLGREPDLMLWRNECGLAHHGRRTVRYGLCPGSADLVGIGPGGRFCAIELKTPSGTLSTKQKQFLALVERRGGLVAVARSVSDAVETLESWRGNGLQL
jgi:hypothetical protein